jgi:sugar-specific transcriptional regulator TrmB
MKSLVSSLEKFHLTFEEIKVYMTLLEGGHMSVVTLSKATEIHRPQLYRVLGSLSDRRLVEAVTVGKRVQYRAASPHVFLEEAQALVASTKLLVPELAKRASRQSSATTIHTYTGEEGISQCFLMMVESLARGDVYYQISSAKDQGYVDSLVPEHYRTVRDKKQLERKAITTRYVGSTKRPRLERTMHYIDDSDEIFEHNVIQFIFGDTVMLLDFNSLTATVIHNAAIADFQRSIFLTLYKRLPAQ